MPEETPTSAFHALRVLVVEDEFLIAIETEKLLLSNGIRVVGPVGREDQALAILSRDPPDAAVLDLNLHGVRPRQLARMLVALNIPFVITTGYGSDFVDEPALQTAPRLSKPVKGDALLAALARVAAARRAN